MIAMTSSKIELRHLVTDAVKLSAISSSLALSQFGGIEQTAACMVREQ